DGMNIRSNDDINTLSLRDALPILSSAGDYGVWPYRTLRADLGGTGLQAHHLIEQRFAAVMGQAPGDMASIAVTNTEHQVFTNARSEEHTSELQSLAYLVCRPLLEK